MRMFCNESDFENIEFEFRFTNTMNAEKRVINKYL